MPECFSRTEGWAAFGLRMVVEGPHGPDVLELEILRPRGWFGVEVVRAGMLVGVWLEELGVHGWAVVTSVGPAPALEPGRRCPVTGRVRHVSHEVISVQLEGGEKLEVTRHHPLMFADRGDWVAEGELRAGERLRSVRGETRVVEVQKAPRAGEEVFNLEVHSQHRYFVGGVGVVAHNMCANTGSAAVHGNSKASLKPNHRYEIVENASGDVVKTGISGQSLNKNGTSPRANPQVAKLNQAEGAGAYSARVVETNLPGRKAGLQAEQAATNQLSASGNTLRIQERPKPQGEQ